MSNNIEKIPGGPLDGPSFISKATEIGIKKIHIPKLMQTVVVYESINDNWRDELQKELDKGWLIQEHHISYYDYQYVISFVLQKME